MQELREIIAQLAAPMPYKWRVQSFSKHKPLATCVAYIDARDAIKRLNETCTWQRDHKEMKGNLYAGVGILADGQWVWRWDCGTESNQDAEKGESSDSFKRACVNFGLGLFLYELGIEYCTANEKKTQGNYPYVIDQNNKRVWDLTDHINAGRNKSKPQAQRQPTAPVQNDFEKTKAELWEACGKDRDALAGASDNAFGIADPSALDLGQMKQLIQQFRGK